MARSGNPLLRNMASPQQGGPSTSHLPTYSPEQLHQLYNEPAATSQDTGRMTYDDVVMRTGITLGGVVLGAVVGWFIPALMLVGIIGGLVLGLVNAFKKEPSPALIIAYAVLEGFFLGGISMFFEAQYPGIVVQAVIGTLSVFAAVLFLVKSGKFRSSPKMNKIFMVAMVGYMLFGLVNLGMVLLGGTNLRFDFPILGIGLGLIAVALAAYSFVLDFENIAQGVRQGVPAKFAWSAAFGLTVTLVWLYVEILRLIAIVRSLVEE